MDRATLHNFLEWSIEPDQTPLNFVQNHPAGSNVLRVVSAELSSNRRYFAPTLIIFVRNVSPEIRAHNVQSVLQVNIKPTDQLRHVCFKNFSLPSILISVLLRWAWEGDMEWHGNGIQTKTYWSCFARFNWSWQLAMTWQRPVAGQGLVMRPITTGGSSLEGWDDCNFRKWRVLRKRTLAWKRLWLSLSWINWSSRKAWLYRKPRALPRRSYVRPSFILARSLRRLSDGHAEWSVWCRAPCNTSQTEKMTMNCCCCWSGWPSNTVGTAIARSRNCSVSKAGRSTTSGSRGSGEKRASSFHSDIRSADGCITRTVWLSVWGRHIRTMSGL